MAACFRPLGFAGSGASAVGAASGGASGASASGTAFRGFSVGTSWMLLTSSSASERHRPWFTEACREKSEGPGLPRLKDSRLGQVLIEPHYLLYRKKNREKYKHMHIYIEIRIHIFMQTSWYTSRFATYMLHVHFLILMDQVLSTISTL